MWFLVLIDSDGSRSLHEWPHESREEAICDIESAVLQNPNTVRVVLVEAREAYRIGLDVRITQTVPEVE